MASLEQIRDIFGEGAIGLIIIGMPGVEKRMARYPQFYSRIGFVHEFLLDQQRLPGDEAVLDVGCGRTLVRSPMVH